MLQEEALTKIQQFHQQLTSGQAEFKTLASQESHCSSAKRGGDLGEFGPGQMQKPFEEATYALKVALFLLRSHTRAILRCCMNAQGMLPHHICFSINMLQLLAIIQDPHDARVRQHAKAVLIFDLAHLRNCQITIDVTQLS